MRYIEDIFSKESASDNVPVYLFNNGKNRRAYEYFGVRKVTVNGSECMAARVWAPNAREVSLVGDFCDWDKAKFPLRMLEGGVWEGYADFVFEPGAVYKFYIKTASGEDIYKSDPYALYTETRPGTASRYYDISGYEWHDKEWLDYKKYHPHYTNPVNIYEVHAGSWKRYADGRAFSYEKLSDELIPYVKEMGFTHIEFMPLTEYLSDRSWGYQTSGYFSPTSRYGRPEDLMRFIDRCHQAQIGVILDWMPAYFPADPAGLAEFDGTPCYEYADLEKREHKEWDVRVFDYGKPEVVSFLISSAVFWLKEYHVDGLRVGAVASMLYLDHNGQEIERTENGDGGKENPEAISFLRTLNEAVFAEAPDVMMIAEESSSWPMVSKPTYMGGLGFNYKWNIGWVSDMLKYMSLDPLFRSGNHNALTFSLFYAFSENYILPLSHDEAAGGKNSLINRMFGTHEQKAAEMRAFITYMMAHPGKKLSFMGTEFAHRSGWDFKEELEWGLLQYDEHKKALEFFRALNHFYLERPELWERDFDWSGFEWISNDDNQQSVIAFRRRARNGKELVAVCNFVPVERAGYCIGVPLRGIWSEVFTSDDIKFGGSGTTNGTGIETQDVPMHGCEQRLSLTLPPTSVLFLECSEEIPKTVSKKLGQLSGSRTKSKKK